MMYKDDVVDNDVDDFSPGDVMSALALEHYERKLLREARIAAKTGRGKMTADHIRILLDRYAPRRMETQKVPF